MISDYDRRRYWRQVSLPEIGSDGQERLLQSSVLIIGAGGLGSPVALYLASAGVGHIGIIDGDRVDTSNLQRQVIHCEASVGQPKVMSAADRMMAVNHELRVTPIFDWLTPANAVSVIGDYDFVVDATDSFEVKFLINDVCVGLGKPFSHGAIARFEGHTMTYVPGSACYRCLFESAPEPAEPVGPFGVLPGVIGVIQATEAIKYLTEAGQLLTNTLLTYDSLSMTFRKLKFGPRKGCECQ